jgi:hypothetical protein
MEKDPIALEAAQASITTATVTIKTLRVNSRQLTLATFRQLPAETLVDQEEIKLLGTTWGWVNYHPYPGEAGKTQFVAQFGDRLCRAPFLVRDLPAGVWTAHLVDIRTDYTDYSLMAILADILRNPDRLLDLRTDSVGDARFAIKVRGPFAARTLNNIDTQNTCIDAELLRAILGATLPYPVKNSWDSDETAQRRQLDWQQGRERCLAMIRDRLAQWGEPTDETAEWWESVLNRMAAEASDYIARWNALMTTLREAEQLYIAT